MNTLIELPVVVIGGGPAGLMAASTLLQAGLPVALYDAMPALGRKFLRAGVGGLNLTHSEPEPDFLQRYHPSAPVADWVRVFGPQHVVDWAAALGIETFTGSSGRVFPVQKKASPLLRAWLQQLHAQGARVFTRHRWLGWQSVADDNGVHCQHHRFNTPEGDIVVRSRATILALGGGSWARLGSDGAWLPELMSHNVRCEPLVASNCGFDVSWSAHLQAQFAGAPLKAIELRVQSGDNTLFRKRGEALISRHGIQGSVIYAASRVIQDEIARSGQARLYWDLLPDYSEERVVQKLQAPRGKESRSNFLRKRLGLTGIKLALLHELMPAVMSLSETSAPETNVPQTETAEKLARLLKSLPMVLTQARPMDEAISTAGGVALDQLNERLMLRQCEGVFCAGEMLAWDAPTGGYLLTACFASGQRAAQGVAAYLGHGH